MITLSAVAIISSAEEDDAPILADEVRFMKPRIHATKGFCNSFAHSVCTVLASLNKRINGSIQGGDYAIQSPNECVSNAHMIDMVHQLQSNFVSMLLMNVHRLFVVIFIQKRYVLMVVFLCHVQGEFHCNSSLMHDHNGSSFISHSFLLS